MSSKERYLGSPLILGHSKQEDFKVIEENFKNRYTSWSSTSLTQVGKATMIKHVLNIIPIYQMGTFKLPTQLLDKLIAIQRRFFWGHNSNRGSNPIGWQKVCKTKEAGGLDFRDLETLNLALLTKLAWRLCNNQDTLWGQIMESKYFISGDILHQRLEAKNCSYTWNGIIKGMKIVQQKIFMGVNNGRRTKIWQDKWIPGLLVPPSPINDYFIFYQTIEELLIPNTGFWNIDLLSTLFAPDVSLKIQSIVLDVTKEDVML
ncbi:uncharacterized protein LOC113351902 [Papaver somniferum]|uniref:uncharacterized protein LOC113351902 n=1 Tax=Papaver somniferum TaxID=3469 RepID=UPI000E6FA720|nr:uncharacterized protein LOC113351902 [Papaver somniferum]